MTSLEFLKLVRFHKGLHQMFSGTGKCDEKTESSFLDALVLGTNSYTSSACKN